MEFLAWRQEETPAKDYEGARYKNYGSHFGKKRRGGYLECFDDQLPVVWKLMIKALTRTDSSFVERDFRYFSLRNTLPFFTLTE